MRTSGKRQKGKSRRKEERKVKTVIIGGVAGGATAAARLRRLKEDAEIVILERSGYVSYANCGLPYYIGGEIAEKSKLALNTPESFFKRFRIDVRVRHEVTEIDPVRKLLTVRRLTDGTQYQESYDKLVLSPGARPVIPSIPGTDLERVFTLRTVEDTFAMDEFIRENNPRSAIVIGGGFIGLEMTENLMRRGIAVTLLQRSGQVFPPFDEDMAAILHRHLREQGVKLHLHTGVTGLCAEEKGILAEQKDGPALKADMVLLAVGVQPDSILAKKAGLRLGNRGSIWTDSHMRTSDADIYAVGDAVEVTHFVTGPPALIALAGPANKQGRIAADTIAGRPSEFHGSQGSSILKLFDWTAAATGINEKEARRQNLVYDKAILCPSSHASYYPGAKPLTMKVLFEKPSGRILGAQIVGSEGVDKRIDVLAAAIRGRMTAEDLTELDLAYAPPYSSAKDPVNMAGYVIENLLPGLVRQVHWSDVEEEAQMLQAASIEKGEKRPFLLDVQTEGEYNRGHIKGAVNIPVDELRGRLNEVPQDRPVYVYCWSGLRSYLACRILSQHGVDCCNVAGGYGFYQRIQGC